MMAVVKQTGATVANKALELVVQDATGLLTDVQAAWFQIFETSTAETLASPVQVFPTTPGNQQPIDVVAERLGPGRYAAVWSPAAGVQYGRYEVRWFYRFTVSATPITFVQEFEVVPTAYNGPAYCTLYDLRAAGLTAIGDNAINDVVGQRLIVQASRYIEHYTGRQFRPSYKVITASGGAGRALLLNEPIVAIESLTVDYRGDFAPADREIGSFQIFNRHIRQNLFQPDDRDNPKLEFLHSWDFQGIYSGASRYESRFAMGVQNVQVAGVFGYTEPDESMVGATPLLIRQACQLICFKQRHAAGTQARTDAMNAHRITSEYTRDQGYIMDKPDSSRGVPFFTHFADPEIDAILYGFVRPPNFGSA